MKRARIVPMLALACVAAAAAQGQEWRGTAALAVEVKGKPLGNVEGALVILRYQRMQPAAGPRPVLTDAAGRAVVADLADGVWEVEVSHEDFLSFVALVVLDDGRKPAVQASFLQASGSSLTPIRVKLLDGRGRTPSAAVPLPPEAAARLAARQPPAPQRPPPPEAPRADARRAPPPVMPEPELRPLPPTAKPDAAPAPPPLDEPAAPAPAPRVAAAAPAPPPEATSAPEPVPPPEPALPPAVTPAPDAAAPQLEAAAPEPPRAEPAPEPTPPAAPTSTPPAAPAPTPTPVPAPEPAAPPAAPSEPATPPAAPPEPVAPPAAPPAAAAPPAPAPEPPVPAPPAAPPEPAPAVAEPESSPAEGAVAPPTEPAPAAAPPPAQVAVMPPPGPLGPTLRAYGDRTCVECRPGEWALSVEAVAGPASGPCDAALAANGTELATLLGGSIALELKEIAAPARQALGELEPGEQAARAAELLGDAKSSCRIVALVIPKAGRFRGVRMEAADASGVGDCQADRPCPVGQARWLGQPRVSREPSANVIWGLFVNEAPDRARRARLTVYFAAPYRAWDPSR